MISSLNPKHGIEVWINKKLEEEIENAFKEVFKSDKLYYYYISCPGESVDDRCRNKHKIVWCGPCGLINYIKKVQSKKFNAPVLGVTSIPCKSKLVEFLEKDDVPFMPPKDYVWKEYWIGDVARNHNMICGDTLFIGLWNRIRDKASSLKK